MAQAFIIMQIGNDSLDAVCEEAIVPALEDCDLEPKRVDKHNQGGLLKNEIVEFIENSEVVVADLTNERPNCYLEVGYAMGLGRTRKLILTVREDHFPDSPNYDRAGPKVHFDLAGYDILTWEPDKMEEFREALVKKIKRRMAIVKPSSPLTENVIDDEWVISHHVPAIEAFEEHGFHVGFEIAFGLSHPKPVFRHKALNDAARDAQVHTFGWPIGIHIETREQFRPKARHDEIVAELIPGGEHASYDYWALRRNGDFYTLIGLFEQSRADNVVFFNTRIVRTTEALLYCARLYKNLGVDEATEVRFKHRYFGFKDYVLSGAGDRYRYGFQNKRSHENEFELSVDFALNEVEPRLTELVMSLTEPFFALFDFAEFDENVYDEIITRFIDGEVS